MDFYTKHIFPHLINWALGGRKIGTYRKALLKEVGGRVLELGSGTGLNLPYYRPHKIKELVFLDIHEGMHRFALKRTAKVDFPVEQKIGDGQKLDFADNSFDAVVSTFTFCSIEDLTQALSEISRVLKPSGHLFFLEHGLSSEANVARRQKFWTPYQKRLAAGCHLDRPIDETLSAAGFKFSALKKFYHDEYPKMFGFFYQGVATLV